jgi:hypothetical protein
MTTRMTTKKIRTTKKTMTESVKHRIIAALSEAMKLDKVNFIKPGRGAEAFAKEYKAAMMGEFRDSGPTPADDKASEKFWTKYADKTTRKGFAGSGTVEYTNKATKETFIVDRSPNGKGFHGTDHTITKK